MIETQIVGNVGASIFLLVSSIMTSFFIPNMLRKGAVDLMISKPINRWVLLLYKYIGGLLFMFLNTVVLIGGFWLVMGMRTGVWGPSFLLMIPVLTFEFAVYYAISTLAAVLTRNTIVAIMTTCFMWLVLFVSGLSYNLSNPEGDNPPSSFHQGTAVVHGVLPRIGDMDQLSRYLVVVDVLKSDDAQKQEIRKLMEDTSWGESIGVSVAFIAVMLGLACWWFSTRDY
jgi:ABC-type transport system involved in multi-copper enzyme maturation permease subunit